MLRIAVPNKGTLSDAAAQMLREAGYRQRTDAKDLVCRDEDNDVEFFYLRPRDIATYVGSGDLDLGITGRDLLDRLRRRRPRSCSTWASARATFRFAARPDDRHRPARARRAPDRHRLPGGGRAATWPSTASRPR